MARETATQESRGTPTRAAVMRAVGAVDLEDITLQEPGPHQVLVRRTAATVCATDTLTRAGAFPVWNPPQIRGHGGVGIVERVGEQVSSLAVGDRVIAAVRLQCGECDYCLRGQAQWCMRSDGGPLREVRTPQGQIATDRIDYPPAPVGTTHDGLPLSAHARVGSFADHMLIPDFALTAITSTISDGELALLACGAGTGLGAALLEMPVEPGSTVAVHGCGVVGQSMILAARMRRAGTVLAIDPDPRRRSQALARGADEVCDPHEVDPARWVWERTQAQGADHAFEAAGTPEAVLAAYRSSRRGGTVVTTGFGGSDLEIRIPMNELAIGGRHLIGSQFGGVQIKRDLPFFCRLIEAGELDLAPLVERAYPLDQLNPAIDAIEKRDVLGAIIVG